MRVLTINELMRVTRTELCGLAPRITTEHILFDGRLLLRTHVASTSGGFGARLVYCS